TVSFTAMPVSVALPLFDTTSRYVTTSPATGLAGVCVLTTATEGTGAAIDVHTWFVGCTVGTHGVFASTTAKLHTVVSTHTDPSTTVTVNVKLAPGAKSAGLDALHTY